MVLIDENLIEELISEYGSDATLKAVDTKTLDKFGEVSQIFKPDQAIKVIVNDQSGKTQATKEGLFQPMGKSYFVHGQLPVNRGDIIVHRDIEYRIDNIMSAELENFIHVQELFVERLI